MYTRGDLTFRNGKLYLSSIQNTLVEVDLNNPMNSTVVMTFPPGTPEIHGLATVYIGCDSVETYAVGSHIFDGSTIYRIDFENQVLEEMCHFDFYITGLATYDECSLPPCALNIDLDDDNSSSALGNDFQSAIVCSFPANITDDDISFFSALPEVDSVIINLTGTQTNGEYLTIPSGSNLDVLGDGSTNIVLVNNGTSTVLDFQNVISTVLYQNDDLIPVFGTREINIIGYSGSYQSSISTAYIPISDPVIDPGFVVAEVSCNGYADASILSEPIGGGAPYGFIWSTNETSELLSQLDTGQYYLTITDALGCTKVDSTIVSQPEELTSNIFNTSFLEVCNDYGTLLAQSNGGTTPYTYNWSNGYQGALNEMIFPGEYTVTVEDANGCQAESTYQLEEGNNVQIDIAEFLCFGENFDVGGQQYTMDTSFCLTFLLPNGCDSLRCYDLSFYEENISFLLNEICYGDSLSVFGNIYSTDTILSMTLSDANGCDSTIIFSLDVFDPVEIIFDTIGNLCADGIVEVSVDGFANYAWSNGSNQSSILVESPGEYEVVVTDANNCSEINTIIIDEPELEIIWSAFDPSCYNYEDGIIQIESITGGQGPYLSSINDQPMQSGNIFDRLGAGTFTLSVEDINGCLGQTIITLNEPDEVYIQGDDFISAKLGESLNIILTTNAIQPLVIWTPSDYLSCDDCLENNIFPLESIIYDIIVKDINDCEVTKSIRIDLDLSSQLFVPNVFSPNDDSVNDIFKIFGDLSIPQINSLKIANRWGDIVYEENNFIPNESQTGWDGFFKNQKASEGAYLVYLQYRDVLGNHESKVYSLTLVR
jgi:gliding motility-associated-like protein